MTTILNDREQAFENKFVHDEEMRFRAISRRNKLIGWWAADKLGKTGDDADFYARDVVRAVFEEGGDHDVFRKLRRDFDAAGLADTDVDITAKMKELLLIAIDQVQNA
jgi:hypothetical protein